MKVQTSFEFGRLADRALLENRRNIMRDLESPRCTYFHKEASILQRVPGRLASCRKVGQMTSSLERRGCRCSPGALDAQARDVVVLQQQVQDLLSSTS